MWPVLRAGGAVRCGWVASESVLAAAVCVEGRGVGVCWCSRPLVGQQVPSRGIKLGWCGGPIDMVAAVEAPATGWRAAVA